MATPIAGEQFHPRIEQRTHSMGILYERRPIRRCCVYADRIFLREKMVA